MTISFLRQSPDVAPLHINGQLLNPVTSFKVLGVIFNHQLKWSDNVDMMVKKASNWAFVYPTCTTTEWYSTF